MSLNMILKFENYESQVEEILKKREQIRAEIRNLHNQNEEYRKTHFTGKKKHPKDNKKILDQISDLDDKLNKLSQDHTNAKRIHEGKPSLGDKAWLEW